LKFYSIYQVIFLLSRNNFFDSASRTFSAI